MTRLDTKLDANPVFMGLWQGSRILPGTDLSRFDVLVLTSTEFQPPSDWFKSTRPLQVIRVPIEDETFKGSPPEVDLVCRAACKVATLIRNGKRVLVTCYMGLNRSGLISALALRLAYDVPADEAIKLVRAAREGALFNPMFVKIIKNLNCRVARRNSC